MATPMTRDAALRTQQRLERRRQSNRAAMQRLRERKQQALDQLRTTAQTLVDQYADLVQRLEARQLTLPPSLQRLLAPSLSTEEEETHRAQAPSAQLEEATRRAQALVAANEQLQKSIDEWVRWEDYVALSVEFLNTKIKSAAPEAPLPPPSTPFEFMTTPWLTEARAMELIMFHRRKRKALKKQWLLASRPPFHFEFFGWDIHYFPQGPYWHLKFTKLFRNVTACSLSRRAWGNIRSGVTYRTRLPNQKLVQVVNENAILFMRWTNGRDHILKQNEVIYCLRFCIQENDGTTVLGMFTLPKAGEESDADGFDDKPLTEGIDMCLSVKLKPVRDTIKGEEHCVVEYSGRTQFGDADHAQLNALEMVISLTKWEKTNVERTPVQLVWS